MTETDVEKLLKAFQQENLEFVIIGGLAAVLQGSAYVTADLDVCYSRKREHLEKLARALAAFRPSLRAVSEQVPSQLDLSALRSGRNFTLTTDVGDVDILGDVGPWCVTRVGKQEFTASTGAGATSLSICNISNYCLALLANSQLQRRTVKVCIQFSMNPTAETTLLWLRRGKQLATVGCSRKNGA